MQWVRKATGSAAVILDEEGRVLLVRRAYPPHDWVLPGGNAEAKESPVDTVVREVAEEIGLVSRQERLIGVFYQADHRAGEFIHFVFRGSLEQGSEIRIDPSEVAAHGFFSTDALPEPMSPSARRRPTDGLAAAPLDLPVRLPPRSEP
jgi:ADP-ribose pyrophosphatase YjhB (NUDIX family)